MQAMHSCFQAVFFCKLHAIVSSNVDYGVLMETDDVVNYNVDVLFDVLGRNFFAFAAHFSHQHDGLGVPGVVVVPWIGLAVLSLAPEDAAHLWLLTAFPWEALEHVSFSSLLTLLGGYWSIIGVLNFQFTYQLRQMGAYSSQALLRSAAR